MIIFGNFPMTQMGLNEVSLRLARSSPKLCRPPKGQGECSASYDPGFYRSKKNQVVIKSLPKTNAGLKVKVKAKIKKKLGKVKVAKNGKVTFRAKRKKGTFTITLTAPAVRGAHPFKAYKKVIKVRIK